MSVPKSLLIKTYPVRMSQEFHQQISEAAHRENLTMEEFFISAICEKIEKQKQEAKNE
jgi:predicted HicB family RNase H-like nuclease